MASLTERERELVAVGTAIAAGCQPCTRHHVRVALESGLPREEVQRAVDVALLVRHEGAVATANAGRPLLELGDLEPTYEGLPADRAAVLAHIGAAAGCNAGNLLSAYVKGAQALGFSRDELRAALEVTKVVKQAAAMFLDREAERAVGPASEAPADEDAPALSCCPTALPADCDAGGRTGGGVTPDCCG